MVYKSKAKVLNSLLCRAGSEEESETATSSLLQCLGHIKVSQLESDGLSYLQRSH